MRKFGDGTRITRRGWLRGGSAAAIALAASNVASNAADWPTRLVTIVVPYAPGGVADLIGRLIAKTLGDKFAQPFIVENRPGASGVVGANSVAHASPDGHTLLLSAPGPLLVIPLLQKVGYDPDRFAPVSIVGQFPLLLAIKASLPAKTLPEFIAYAKANPGKLNYSSGGVGQVSHLIAALFALRAGLDIVHIPYNKGSAPAVAALVAGEVDMHFGIPSEIYPHLSGDRIRILATTGSERISTLPNIPTINETFPGFKLAAWNGVLAPPGTPRDIVDKISEALIGVSKTPLMVDRLTKLGIFPAGVAPDEFAKVIADDKVFYKAAIKAAGLV